jgi:hypothetical protein
MSFIKYISLLLLLTSFAANEALAMFTARKIFKNAAPITRRYFTHRPIKKITVVTFITWSGVNTIKFAYKSYKENELEKLKNIDGNFYITNSKDLALFIDCCELSQENPNKFIFEEGITPFMCACKIGNVELAQRLLDFGGVDLFAKMRMILMAKYNKEDLDIFYLEANMLAYAILDSNEQLIKFLRPLYYPYIAPKVQMTLRDGEEITITEAYAEDILYRSRQIIILYYKIRNAELEDERQLRR